MEHHHAGGAEARAQQRLQLRREVDLRHQHQDLGALILLQAIFDRPEVHLGLAASGDAEQQVDPEPLRRDQRLDGGLLLRRQAVQRRRVRPARNLALAQPRQRLCEARPRRGSQHRGQRRQRNFSPWMLVVVGRELREVEPVAIERLHLVDDEADILQARLIDVAPAGGVDDQPHPGSPPNGDYAHLPGHASEVTSR